MNDHDDGLPEEFRFALGVTALKISHEGAGSQVVASSEEEL
jgi:hypothetical protein